MSPKEAAFVREYIKDRNATQAAIRAGYSARTASRNGQKVSQRPHVRAAIAAEDERLAAESRRGRNEVIADAMVAQAMARAADDVGNLCRALELEAKLRGLLTEKRQVEQVGEYVIRWAGLGDYVPEADGSE